MGAWRALPRSRRCEGLCSALGLVYGVRRPGMRTIDMQRVEAHSSRLVDEAANGEPFIITLAGKGLVKVVPLAPEEQPISLFGCMAGEIKIPDDFDTMGQDEIIAVFEGKDSTEREG